MPLPFLCLLLSTIPIAYDCDADNSIWDGDLRHSYFRYWLIKIYDCVYLFVSNVIRRVEVLYIIAKKQIFRYTSSWRKFIKKWRMIWTFCFWNFWPFLIQGVKASWKKFKLNSLRSAIKMSVCSLSALPTMDGNNEKKFSIFMGFSSDDMYFCQNCMCTQSFLPSSEFGWWKGKYKYISFTNSMENYF